MWLQIRICTWGTSLLRTHLSRDLNEMKESVSWITQGKGCQTQVKWMAKALEGTRLFIKQQEVQFVWGGLNETEGIREGGQRVMEIHHLKLSGLFCEWETWLCLQMQWKVDVGWLSRLTRLAGPHWLTPEKRLRRFNPEAGRQLRRLLQQSRIAECSLH